MSYVNTIMITLVPSSPDFVVLQTYDYEHGKSARFYIHRADLERLIADQSSLLDSDLNNYLQAYREGNHLHFKATWLSVNWQDQVTGYVQHFDLPLSSCVCVLNGYPVKKAAYISDEKPKATLRISPEGHRQIRHLCSDKLTRRALIKFFRDRLNYGADEVLNITRDVGGLYFFSRITDFEGGIIRHKTEQLGRDGKPYPKVFFGMHT